MRVLLVFLVLAISISAENFRGRVIAVLDGDTLDVLVDRQPRRIRLFGVDAPEKSQAFGQRAKQATARLLFGTTVGVIDHGRDRYGRTLGEVFLPNGTSLNQRLVEEGFAWHYVKYSSDSRLAALEQAARAARRGLWVDSAPVPPWEFRAAVREFLLSEGH